ncbi:MAG: lysophospholipid acyltransferase family protein [Rudaea sp.]
MAKKSGGRTNKSRPTRSRRARTPHIQDTDWLAPQTPDGGEPIVDTFDIGGTTAEGESPEQVDIPTGPNGAEKTRRTSRTSTAGKKRRQKPVEPTPESEPSPGPQPENAPETPDASLRDQLLHELREMVGRLRSLHPTYRALPVSPGSVIDPLLDNIDRFAPGLAGQLLGKLRSGIGSDLLQVDTWKGIWYVLNSTLQYQGDVLKRRVSGEYETDEWGMDAEIRDAVLPFFQFMYKTYWRVEMTGLDNVPAEGRALLVSNHSGQLPWDGAMISTGILLDHPAQRVVRPLYASWFPTLPFIGDFVVKIGGVLATEENGTRLLEQDQPVLVLPEGYKGVGKLFKDRYRLARFGRGGFVRMALKSRAPIVPVAVVGAEETYISLAKSELLAKLTGFPYFPISPTWPWTGLLGFIPLPTKWYIDFGAPIATDVYDEGSENNPVLISELTELVRNTVQEMIYSRLAERRSVF